MQMLYQGYCRKLYINSLPAPDSLLVTRSEREKLWNRAMVIGDCAEGEVEVFFLDLGHVEVVPLSKLATLAS